MKALLAALTLLAMKASGQICEPVAFQSDIQPGDLSPILESLANPLTSADAESRLRSLVWKRLFSRVVEPASQADCKVPVWQTWRERKTIFDTRGFFKARFGKERTPLVFGTVLETAKQDPHTQFGQTAQELTFFNNISLNRLVDSTEPLTSRSTLTTLKNSGIPKIQEFPVDAVVIKTFWYKLSSSHPFVRVGVWHPEKATGGKVIQEPDSFGGQACIYRDSPTRCGLPPSYPATSLYTINCQSSLTCAKDDLMILMGMHITVKTKDVPNWLWATFWWNPKGGEGNPMAGNSPWHNYEMDAVVSSEVPRNQLGPIANANFKYRAIFNPYIEAKLPNGTSSNCMTCHQAAMFPQHPVKGPRFIPDKQSLLSPDDFKDSVQTDFIWSVPLHAK